MLCWWDTSEKAYFENKFQCSAHKFLQHLFCIVHLIFQNLLEGSQGQQIEAESKLREEYRALEKKYHKAKKLIKEFQSRYIVCQHQDLRLS